MKRQQAQDLKREAHLSAEAEANKRSTADRDQALRQAAQQTGLSALPAGLLSQEVVKRQVFLLAFFEACSFKTWPTYVLAEVRKCPFQKKLGRPFSTASKSMERSLGDWENPAQIARTVSDVTVEILPYARITLC